MQVSAPFAESPAGDCVTAIIMSALTSLCQGLRAFSRLTLKLGRGPAAHNHTDSSYLQLQPVPIPDETGTGDCSLSTTQGCKSVCSLLAPDGSCCCCGGWSDRSAFLPVVCGRPPFACLSFGYTAARLVSVAPFLLTASGFRQF